MITITKKIIRFILQNKNRVPGDSSRWPISWKTIEYKTYDRFIGTTITNSNKGLTQNNQELMTLVGLLQKRKSNRDLTFAGKKITTDDLCSLLSFSAGEINLELKKRSYPSGGQLYPVELYYINLVCADDSEMAPGVYHFSPCDNSISCIKTIQQGASSSSVIGSPYEFLDNASGFIVCTLIPKRNVPKYGWLGIRLGLIEVGEIIQNIYLLAAAMEIKCCAVAGFDAEKVDELLDIDGLNEMSVMVVSIG